MLLDWFKRRSRKKLRGRGLPEGMRAMLPEVLWQFESLDAADQQELQAIAAVLIAEKRWEGCGGQVIDERVKLAIAAQAALVVLRVREEYFDRVLSVLVYPDAYRAPEQHSPGGGLVIERESTRVGEAWYRGPVVLSWRDVQHAGESRNYGRSLVAHEFAHQLDMLNGRGADGVPPMRSDQHAEQWIAVMDAALSRLRRDCRRGGDPVMDCYGATDRSEFFAVASEVFFQWPARLAEREPDLFAEMKRFYGLDPERWDGR